MPVGIKVRQVAGTDEQSERAEIIRLFLEGRALAHARVA